MNEVLNFINDKTRILLIISENQLEIKGKNICPLNQQEIASLAHCGKLKANQIIKELTINEQIQNIAQKKDTLCRRMYN